MNYYLSLLVATMHKEISATDFLSITLQPYMTYNSHCLDKLILICSNFSTLLAAVLVWEDFSCTKCPSELDSHLYYF